MGSIYQYLSGWFRFSANACLVHMKIIHLLNIFSFSVNIRVELFFSFILICVCKKNWRRQNTKRLYFVWCPRKMRASAELVANCTLLDLSGVTKNYHRNHWCEAQLILQLNWHSFRIFCCCSFHSLACMHQDFSLSLHYILIIPFCSWLIFSFSLLLWMQSVS